MALATNGYFSHGYGVKSMGMAGVGIALPQDGLAAATNPAGTAFVGDRLDLGLTWFRPSRGAEIRGNGCPRLARPLNGSYDGNDNPELLHSGTRLCPATVPATLGQASPSTAMAA